MDFQHSFKGFELSIFAYLCSTEDSKTSGRTSGAFHLLGMHGIH